ncbi:MAG: hypothetical protein LC731_07600 [Acidobacteria bacterium]|nr:hypothetical protein [Acidobacteriota bacterium]
MQYTRTRFFALSLFICLVAGARVSAQTQPWTKFSSPEGRFTVLMPLEPKMEEESKDTSVGRVVMRFFTAGSEKGIFVVAYADYSVCDAKRELDANRDSFLRGMKATLVSESDIKLQDNPGREIKAVRDNLSIRSRIYLVGRRYYQIMAITPATLPANLEADKFFASFELTSGAASTAAPR